MESFDKTELGDGISPCEWLQRTQGIGLIGVDATLRLVQINAEARAWLSGETDAASQPPALPEPLQELLHKTLRTGKEQRAELDWETAEEGAAPFDVQTLPWTSPDARTTGATGVITSLGWRRRLELLLKQLDRLAEIGAHSAAIAHEVKNAMVAVKTFVDLLLKDCQDHELADLVNKELRRINFVVTQLLRFAGPVKPALRPVRLHDVLDQSLRVLEYQIEGKGIRLKRLFEAPIDTIKGNRYQLEQAFTNLLVNAVEALSKGGRLQVATELINSPADGSGAAHTTQNLCVRITDTGEGIPPDKLPRLFEPFFTTKPGGTGLGLAITRRIVHEHGGDIQVDSKPGRGTTFRLLFPVYKTRSRSSSPSARQSKAA